MREKEKQAKLFLALMDLMNKEGVREAKSGKLLQVHRTATMVDDRYVATEQEREEVLKNYFPDGLEGPLKTFPKKEKRKLIILKHLMNRFEQKVTYTEKEVNAILKTAQDDFVTLRRSLIEYGFMDRKDDCSTYWVKL
jgi:hypothetical protein